MAEIIEITDLGAKELEPYVCTNEVQLKRYYEPKPGIFIAESPKVVRRALEAGYEPISLLCEKKYIDGQAQDIISACDGVRVYTAASDVLTELTGFKLTQGLLCAMRRREPAKAEYILKGCTRVAVLENVMNQTNVGAIFRNAAALGIDAVLLTKASSDPLYRRSVRVSMGTVFQIPWTFLEQPVPDYVRFLKEHGFATAAMALRNNTVSISSPIISRQQKLAVILGTEGEGLDQMTISDCDFTVKIPMYHGVDSLNVATAGAIAFWELTKNKDTPSG
ncbi:RNA methyltransferase [Ruminococcus sp. FC2018]|uniref:TrmH family RNA methyltransferase n=1 Tax=Ruminococcus sp. FC2018 TaxID=1410617 RepID=UPI00048AEFBA|nr:RNA methyltransferase [Ruminococcus sp. FC2018]